MGWKGYELKIPVGMIFRKMYCCKCGARLVKHKTSRLYKKGDVDYQSHILGHSTLGMSKILSESYIYFCPICENITTYDQQLEVARKQKALKCLVLPDKDT